MQNNKAPLARMMANIKTHDRALFALCALYTFFAVCVPLFSVALPRVLVGYLTGDNPDVDGVVKIVACFFAAGAVVYFFSEWLNELCYPRLTSLRIDYVRDQVVKLLGMDYKNIESADFFEKNEKALEAMSDNSNGIEGIYHKLFALPQLVLIVVVLAIIIGFKNIIILAAILVHVIATTLIALAVQKYEYSRKEELNKRLRRIDYYARAAKDFSSGKDVRVYDLKARVLENFKTEIRGYVSVFAAIKNREYALGFVTLATLLVSDLATYGMLTYLVLNGMPIAEYSMYIAAAVSLSTQMTALSDNITFIMHEHMYVKDFYQFMDSNLGEKGGELCAPSADEPIEIEFEHVTFRYPNTDNNIFEDFSLKIPAGQKLALVGINGAGKTTFVKLLTGLFDADAGRILINGRNIKEYRRQELFKMFAAVFQDVNVFAFTVAQNVACRLDGFDRDRVGDALRQVGLADKIASLPKGADTMMLKVIEEDGAMLSGGESQKLSIARALYKGGSCVIMDEPTAALDALAEAEIYSQFDKLTRGKTAIYISHRLASTQFCDKIALIDGTGLREYGTHDELMRLGGEYREMFVTQGKYYREGGEAQA